MSEDNIKPENNLINMLADISNELITIQSLAIEQQRNIVDLTRKIKDIELER